MLYGVFILLLCQLIGEAARRGLGVPVPGPVIGILLLLAYLALAERWSAGPDAPAVKGAHAASDGLLSFLGLMFVPAGVGAVQSYGLLTGQAAGLALVLVGSTLIALLVTVGVFRAVRRLQGDGEA